MLALFFSVLAVLVASLIFPDLARFGGWGLVSGYLAVLLLPALLYAATAFYLRRSKEWAVVVGLVTASLHGVCAIGAFIASLYDFPYTLILSAIIAAWVLALWHLIQHLKHAAEAIRICNDNQQRGFEVLPLASETRGKR